MSGMSPERSIKMNIEFIILNNVISQYIYLVGIIPGKDGMVARQQSVVMRDCATRRKEGYSPYL